MAKKSFDVTEHMLVPKHSLLSEREKEKLFKEKNITLLNLPFILLSDPAIASLGAKVDDVIKVERKSPTVGTHNYYRRVING